MKSLRMIIASDNIFVIHGFIIYALNRKKKKHVPNESKDDYFVETKHPKDFVWYY